MSNADLVRAKSLELIAKGNAMFGTNVTLDRIEWYPRGRAAGMAGRSLNRVTREAVYFLRYSMEVARNDINALLSEVVPHEVAHLIAFQLGDMGHGRVWKRVCALLGGTGERCHNLEITKARRTRMYVYKLISGEEIKFKGAVHRNLVAGRSYILNSTKERVSVANYTGRQVME